MTTRKAAMRVVLIGLKAAVFVLFFLGIIYAGQRAFQFTHAVFSDQPLEKAPGSDKKLQISEDISGKKLAEFLEKNGIVKSANEFQIQMKYHGYSGNVKAGTYVLNTSMRPSEILEILFGEDGGDT